MSSKALTVCVSAFAVLSFPHQTVLAAPTINCTQGVSYGRIIPNCTGNITVRATSGSGTVNNGCHTLVSGVIRPGLCTIQTTLGTATMDARITFTRGSLQFNNGASGLVTYDQYLIQTPSGSKLNTHTFNAALLNPSHNFKIGGRMRFGSNEPSGTYSSNIQVVVTSIP